MIAEGNDNEYWIYADISPKTNNSVEKNKIHTTLIYQTYIVLLYYLYS